MYQLVETVVTKYLNVESIDVHSVVTEALVKHVDKLVVSCNDYFFNSCHIMSNGVVLYCSLKHLLSWSNIYYDETGEYASS